MQGEAGAREKRRNKSATPVNWRFWMADARETEVPILINTMMELCWLDKWSQQTRFTVT